MQQIGIVKSINEQTATVKIIRKSACSGNCSGCTGCDLKYIEVDAICNIKVLPGQKVMLYSTSSYILLGLFCLFIIPIAIPVFTYIFLSTVNTILAGVCAFLSFVFCGFIVYKLSRSKKYLKMTKPKIISILDNI